MAYFYFEIYPCCYHLPDFCADVQVKIFGVYGFLKEVNVLYLTQCINKSFDRLFQTLI